MVAYAPGARPQEQDPQAETKPNGQVKAVEPEADTNAGTEALQKATQNPVASLCSVPLRNNDNFGLNPGYRTQDVLDIQPVIPIGVSKDWNLLVRWIAPIVYQPVPNAPGAPETGEYGLGDMVPTFDLIAEDAREVDLGYRTGPPVAYSLKYDSATGQVSGFLRLLFCSVS